MNLKDFMFQFSQLAYLQVAFFMFWLQIQESAYSQSYIYTEYILKSIFGR